ncbi:MAG: hypothetical protein GT598_14925 [Bacteroidales bacterium]|nr:hypothetical protein [Bacteroidales bacterium]
MRRMDTAYKKTITEKLIIYVVLIASMVGCDKVDYKMKITNNSNSTIYFYYSFSYPDTTIRAEGNPLGSPDNYRILSGETITNPMRGSWEGQFDIYSTLMIFIFDEATLKTVPWDTIRKNYMILKRYDLSYEDLVKMDWRVTYP